MALLVTWFFAAQLAAPPPDIAAAFAKDAVTGRAVALVENGAIAFTGGYGLADSASRRAVDPQTIFRAGSIGKSVVGVSVMMLVEEGKLRLDDKLAALAPEIAFENPWEASDPIRLVHLLEHTAGWADLSPREFALDDPEMSLIDGIRAGGTRVSRYPPGRYHAYSGAGHSIAAYVVEKRAGIPFHEFARTRIFEPLGMRTATYRKVAGMAASYLPDGRATPYQHYPLYPSGGLNLSITDLGKFVAFLAGGGGGLLRPDSIQRLQRAETTLAARSGLAHGYGLGVMSYVGHSAVLMGHGGSIDSFDAIYRYEPNRRRGYAVMVNAGSIPPAAVRALNEYLGDSGAPAAVQGTPATMFAEYAGTYQPIAQRNRITPLLDSLTTFVRVGVARDRILIGGAPRVVLPGGLLQATDRAAPTMVFAGTPGGHELLAATSSLRKVSQGSVLAKMIYGALFAIAALAALLAVIVETARRRFSRAAAAGLVAFIPVLGLMAVMMAATTMPSPVSIRLFGNASWLSITVFVLTLLVPVGAIYSLFAAFAPGRGGRWSRGVALLSGAIILTAAAYLATYGWIGLRTWAMTN